MRLDATAEIEVVFLRAVTCESTIERQRYELLGNEEVAAPAGRFVARRWRYTALSSGWSRDLPRNGLLDAGLPRNGLHGSGLLDAGLPRNGLPRNGLPRWHGSPPCRRRFPSHRVCSHP